MESEMTLDTLDQKMTGLREQANTMRQGYQDTVARVNGDSNLSPEGKAGQLSGLYERTAQQTEALRQQEDKLIADERLYLERSIGGTVGFDVISYRDARDRAAKIDGHAAARTMMTDALRAKDTELAKAVLDRSVDGGFGEAVDLYTQANPDMASKIGDLYDLSRWTSDANFRMHQMFAYVIPR